MPFSRGSSWQDPPAGFLGGSEVKASACSAGDLGSIPGLGRSPGEGNGNPLQYSCLENPSGGLQSMGLQGVRHDWSTSPTHSLLTIWATQASMWTCFFLFRDPRDWPGCFLSSADCSAVDGSGGCGQGTWVSYKVLTSGMLSALPMSVSALPLRTNGYLLRQHQLSRKLV